MQGRTRKIGVNLGFLVFLGCFCIHFLLYFFVL